METGSMHIIYRSIGRQDCPVIFHVASYLSGPLRTAPVSLHQTYTNARRDVRRKTGCRVVDKAINIWRLTDLDDWRTA